VSDPNARVMATTVTRDQATAPRRAGVVHHDTGPDRIPLANDVVPKDSGGVAVRPGQGGQDPDGGALPAPFGPRNPDTWPRVTVRSIPSSARVWPQTLTRPRASIAGLSPAIPFSDML
jgi:hypothetical protein